MPETMIKIENLKKKYKLGAIGGTTLTAEIQSWWAKKRGKDDPNLPIGTDVTKLGKTFWALNGINMEVKKGERLGIIGHNGAGKSTMLKILSRITAPTEGTIGLNGRITSMLEVGTGFHGELTGRQNIYMNGAILGMTKKEIDAKIEEIIDFSELREFIDTPVKRYSSGMYVKLGFAVAAHLDSEIMIMDEVLAVGDMAFQKKCLDKMRETSEKEDRTILYVSHNMNTIRQLCERVVVLNKGTIIYDGDVEKGIAEYLGEKTEAKSTFFDLNNSERPTNITEKAFIHDIKFNDSTTGIFSRDNPISFTISWTAMDNIESVFFRMIIRHASDIPVGLVQSDNLGNFITRQSTTHTFEFMPDLLADGKYFFSIALYQKDDLGHSIALDHITRACYFEIMSSHTNIQNLAWEHQWWGSIMFPKLNIKR